MAETCAGCHWQWRSRTNLAGAACKMGASLPGNYRLHHSHFYRYAALTGDNDVRERARRMADWEIEIQHPSGGVLAGALGDSDQPTVFNTGEVILAGFELSRKRATNVTAKQLCVPRTGYATSWMTMAAGGAGDPQ